MSFGVNNPNGFVPLSIQDVQGTPNVPFDESYSIQSGYNQNIGCGDLVILNNINVVPSLPQGFLINYLDYLNYDRVTKTTFASAGPVLGVFIGVSYERVYERGDTPYIPAWRNSWVAGTTTQGGAPAKARIIPLTYNYRWSCQMDINGFSATGIGNFVAVQYQVDANGKVVLGKDGSSTIYLSTQTATGGYGVIKTGSIFSQAGGTGESPEQGVAWTLCQVIGFDNRNGENQAEIPYGQVQVRLCDAQLPMISSRVSQA